MLVFCMFLRSHRLLAERERATQSRNLNAWFFRIFKRLSFPACLHSFWFTSRPTRAQRARENDAESTETWRVIDSGANERSRFVFSRSLSRLGSVALLFFFFLLYFVLFSTRLSKISSHNTKNNDVVLTILTPPAFFFLLLVDVVRMIQQNSGRKRCD